MNKTRPITVHLTEDEAEWLRRRAHWDGSSMSAVMRRRLLAMIASDGYLRPPDDEPQDFGYEKEQMQLSVTCQHLLD